LFLLEVPGRVTTPSNFIFNSFISPQRR